MTLPIPVVWSDDCLRHEPGGEVWLGEREPGTELPARAVIRWSIDGWATANESNTAENAFGIHLADLPVASAPVGTTLAFTFHWLDAGCWENVDFSVGIEDQNP